VSALLRVRQGTVSLKHRVVELNDEVQKSGGGVADKVSSNSAEGARLHSLLNPLLHTRKKLCSTLEEWDRTSTMLLIRSRRACESSTWPARSPNSSRTRSSSRHCGWALHLFFHRETAEADAFSTHSNSKTFKRPTSNPSCTTLSPLSCSRLFPPPATPSASQSRGH